MTTPHHGPPPRLSAGQYLAAIAMLILLGISVWLGGAAAVYGQDAAKAPPPVYITNDHHDRVPGAKQALWLQDAELFDVHRGDREDSTTWPPRTVAQLLERGVATAEVDAGGIVWANAENDNSEYLAVALQRLRAIHGDTPIGCFAASKHSVYREAARSPRRLAAAASAWRAHHDAIIDGIDYVTVYAYRLTPSRAEHLRGVAGAVAMARQVYPSHPIYLATWTTVHPRARRMGDLAGRPMPADELAWEAEAVWPLADGVVVFADGGVTDEQAKAMEPQR